MNESTTKTLIFSFDGTGNEPSNAGEFKEDESISNVLKLHMLMAGGVTANGAQGGASQLAYYYNGIGTREGGMSVPLLGRLFSFVRKTVNMVMAPSFGDAGKILREAMQDFETAMNGRDAEYVKLVIFGYSRGAALARKFASMILNKREYLRVAFLGVFDTVAAMDGIHRRGEKVSSDVVFENGTLNGRIDRAVHLVSIDEDRVAFTPTLMNKEDDTPDNGNHFKKRILEVWFPGIHGDVGGGYWFDGLSDLALAFMIQRCKDALGGNISIDEGVKPANIKALIPTWKDDPLSRLEVDDIAVHPRTDGVPHALGGFQAVALDREPRFIHVSVDDKPSKDELPLLHCSVKRRFHQVPAYRPPALRGLDFKLLLPNGSDSGMLHGVSGLRAYDMPSGITTGNLQPATQSS